MALTSGTRLGPYEILSPIGAGGMGEVYTAKDTRLDRTVAIKALPEHFAESPERKARFEREAKAISQLNHPHICTLYDVGEQDGIDFIVMEYIEGERRHHETMASRACFLAKKKNLTCPLPPRVPRERGYGHQCDCARTDVVVA